MQEFITRYSKLLFTGSFISVLAWLSIIVNKYGHAGRQGFELNIVLYSLSVYAVTVPVVLCMLRLFTFRGIISGIVFLLLLSAELFLWVILFHGLKSLPAVKDLIYFCIPAALFFVFALFCLLFTSRQKHQPE